jgi:ankyrin repeat protein
MNRKTFTLTTIASLSIAASLFISGIMALQLVSIIVATITACLSAILVTFFIDHIIYPSANQKIINRGLQDGKEKAVTYTNLHDAARNKNIAEMQRQLHAGADVNTTNRYSETPLHIATEVGDAKMVAFLISAKANIHATEYHGHTPLFFAIDGGHIEIVKQLISAGVDIFAIGHDTWNPTTPLHIAIKAGHMSIVKLLIEKKADIEATANDVKKSTPMRIAIENNRLDIMQYLINQGATIHDHYLEKACKKGQVEIVKRLIQKGANVNALDVDNNNLLLDVIDGLHDNPEREEAYVEIAKLLIQAGIDVNYLNNHGVTALHMAVMDGENQIAISTLLIQEGAKVDAAVPEDSPLQGLIMNELPNWKHTPLTPLVLAMCNNLPITLNMLYHGKVPYADIPTINDNSTSDYIQRQYQLATAPSLGSITEYAQGFFLADFPASKKAETMAQLSIFVKHTKAKDVYPLTMELLRNGRELTTELIAHIMAYLGPFPKNLDLSPLAPIPSSSNDMAPPPTTYPAPFNPESSKERGLSLK